MRRYPYRGSTALYRSSPWAWVRNLQTAAWLETIDKLTTDSLPANLNRLLTPIISLTVYAFLSRNAQIGSLNSERMFTSLAFLEIFAASFLQFIQTITGVATSIGCIQRIDKFLCSDCQIDSRNTATHLSTFEDHVLRRQLYENGICVEARGVSVLWSKDQRPVLHDITFCVPELTLTMIYGPVGCGKTTLLNAILGEAEITAGSLWISTNKVAYCDQTAWLTNQTIQANIIGNIGLDPEWYHTVVEVCGLTGDLVKMPDGDQTQIGNRGISLSGGQRQRLVSFS